MLERNDRIGGCLRTEDITAPGFIHDVMATTFVLFVTSPAYAVLGPELAKRGVIFADSDRRPGFSCRTDGTPFSAKAAPAMSPRFDALAAGDGAALRGPDGSTGY